MSPRRLRPVGAPLYASMQIDEVGLEIRLVLVPGDAVDARCRPALQLVKRKAQQVDVHMVQERRQPDPFIPPCGATYAVPCLGYACPALGLVRAAPDRIALGPAPSPPPPPRPTRPCSAASPYYGRVALPPAVHHRIGAIGLADAGRPGRTSPDGQPVDLPVPVQMASTRAGGLMTTQSRGGTRRDAPPRVAFRFSPQRRRSGWGNFSLAHGNRFASPVNASPTASRPPTHELRGHRDWLGLRRTELASATIYRSPRRTERVRPQFLSLRQDVL